MCSTANVEHCLRCSLGAGGFVLAYWIASRSRIASRALLSMSLGCVLDPLKPGNCHVMGKAEIGMQAQVEILLTVLKLTKTHRYDNNMKTWK